MKGFFIDKGTEVGVYRGGFDKNWIVKDRHSFFRPSSFLSLLCLKKTILSKKNQKFMKKQSNANRND